MFKAVDVAFRFGIPVGELESEGRGLGMNAVSASDRRRVLKFKRTAFEHGFERFKIVANDQRSFVNLKCLRGIDDIVRRQSKMKPTRFRTNFLRDSRGECNYVVLNLGFERLDACKVEIAVFANGLGSRLRNHAGFGQRLRSRDFNAQPHAELVFVTPDAAHFGPGVAWDHALASTITRKLPEAAGLKGTARIA